MGYHHKKKSVYTLNLIPAGGRLKPVTLLKGKPVVFVLVPFLFIAIVISLTTILIVFTPLRNFLPGQSFSGHQKQLVALQAARVDSLVLEIQNMREFSEKMEGFMFQEKAITQEGELTGDVIGRSEFGTGIAPFRSSDAHAKSGRFTGRLVKGSISQRFKPERSHYGIDIATPRNEPVGAVADGTVIFADWTGSFGYTIIIDHNEYTTFYKHCSRLFKKGGEQVRLGEVIALAGDTGQESSGIHLHFEVWKNGVPVDPEKYLIFSM